MLLLSVHHSQVNTVRTLFESLFSPSSILELLLASYSLVLCNLGFNCGEAANFGTPQWLKIAKEAAVRRAAMSYLPMLSHQQLLYLLTMSFVSRSVYILLYILLTLFHHS